MAETVKVIVRCRPMNKREKDLNSKCVVFMNQQQSSCIIINPSDSAAPPKTFTFDGVYDDSSTTEQIYNDIAYPLVEGVLEGYNSTVFAYGQTGCGKSFTMQGVRDPASQRGVIPRAFEHIFEAVSVAEGTKYLVLASYLEIYNEEIRDLLGNDVKKKLDLKEHAEKGLYVQDLSLHPVQNVADCEALMERGWRNRATGATLMNSDSSRSHSIFSINLEMMPVSVLQEDPFCRKGEHIRRGKLNLVDLAGSERQAKTGATGERLKEATKINLSLSALGNVISALVDGKSKHIPYRDSKLTRLLQDSLGGNTKTLMVACLSPSDNNYDETLSTVRYANRAKNIQNKPRINEDPKDTMLREYQEEILKLKTLLENSQSLKEIHLDNETSERLLEQEREKVRLEYEQKMIRMREEYEAEQNHKNQLQNDMLRLKQHYEDQLSRINAQAEKVANEAPLAVTASTPSEMIVQEALRRDNDVLNAAQQEVLVRLQKLQKSMVGGERANDKEAKERRLRKKRASERRLQALAKVLSKVDDDEGVMLQVYDDIEQELALKTEALRKYKNKVRALEREISDLQSEFENDRTDYLETIRRLDRQLKLYQQITERIVPTLRKECNYSNLEKIKNDAVWSDDAQRWRLPELTISRTRLPPAAREDQLKAMSKHMRQRRERDQQVHAFELLSQPEILYPEGEEEELPDILPTSLGGQLAQLALAVPDRNSTCPAPPLQTEAVLFGIQPTSLSVFPTSASPSFLHSNRSSGSSDKSSKSSSPHHHRLSSPELWEDGDRSIIQKLQKSEEEDIAGNYFKPKRATELLNRAKEDASRAFTTWRDYTSRAKGNSANGINNVANSSLNQSGFHSSLNALNLNSSLKGNSFLNNSWGSNTFTSNGNGWIGNGVSVSPDLSVRRPVRLQALPVLDKKYNNKRRNGKVELDTMDII